MGQWCKGAGVRVGRAGEDSGRQWDETKKARISGEEDAGQGETWGRICYANKCFGGKMVAEKVARKIPHLFL